MRRRGCWMPAGSPVLPLLLLLLLLLEARVGHSFNTGLDVPPPPPHAAARAAFHRPLPAPSSGHWGRRVQGRTLVVMMAGSQSPPGVAETDEAEAAEEQEDFLGRLHGSLLEEEERTFVRLTLTSGKGKGKDGGTDAAATTTTEGGQPPLPVDKLLARLIEGAGGAGGSSSPDPRVQVVYTHPTSTTTKTLALAEAPASLAQSVRGAVRSGRLKAARLFTTEADWVLERGKGGLRLYRNKATFTEAEVGVHNRAKKRRLSMPGLEEEGQQGEGGAADAGGGFMEAYGVLDSCGQPKKGMRDKHRQIERFVEILQAQLKQWEEADGGGEKTSSPGPRRLRLLDAGCGKGLLTFAAYEFLTAREYAVEACGVDIRPDVVAKANAVAASLGYTPGLTFVQGSIAALAAGDKEFDVVIALHACDTATDDALQLGIQSGAAVILTSPCCHREVRQEMKRAMKREKGEELAAGLAAQAAVLRHGILLERHAEIVTDSLRALCLESQGYKAQVIEFINDEATSKNLMLTATRRRRNSAAASSEQAARQLRELLGHWGLRTQHLAQLLGLLDE